MSGIQNNEELDVDALEKEFEEQGLPIFYPCIEDFFINKDGSP